MFKGSGPLKQSSGGDRVSFMSMAVSVGEPRPVGVADRCSVKACPYPATNKGMCKAHLNPTEFRAKRGKSWLRGSSNVNVFGYGVANKTFRAKYGGK